MPIHNGKSEMKIAPAPDKGFGVLEFSRNGKSVFVKWQTIYFGPESNLKLKYRLCSEFHIEQYNPNKANLGANDSLRVGMNKYYAKHFGPRLNHLASCAYLSAYYYPQSKLVKSLVTRKWGQNVVLCDLLDKIDAMKEVVDQAISDGLSNLVPLIIETGKTPKELRLHFGKGLWKRIAKQSLSANVRLARLISLSGRQSDVALPMRYEGIQEQQSEFIKAIVSEYLACKAWVQEVLISSIFREDILDLHPSIIKILSGISVTKKAFPYSGSGYRYFNNLFSLFLDGLDLASVIDKREGGKSLIPRFRDYAAVARWHDNLVRKNNKAKAEDMSKNTFHLPANAVSEWTLTDGDNDQFQFTLLKSEYDLFIEGVEMHHCIHSYFDEAKSGKVLCYSIKQSSNKKARSTLAFQVLGGRCDLIDLKSYTNNQVSVDIEVAVEQFFGHVEAVIN